LFFFFLKIISIKALINFKWGFLGALGRAGCAPALVRMLADFSFSGEGSGPAFAYFEG